MHPKPLNLAVVGAGRIGCIHARNIATRILAARLAGVADINLSVAREVATQFGAPCATADYHELLRDGSIHALIISCATDAHMPIVEQAAAARKHIFCEKPIGNDLPGIWRALDSVENAGVKLQVGFNRRFDPTFAKVKELVAAGRIGTPHIVRITSRDPSPPPIEYVRASGGLPLDMTIHDFDMVRFLTGQEVEEVYAVGEALIDPEVGRAGDVDTCVITMRLRGGAFATIDNSRQATYGYDQRVEVFGSRGMVAAGSSHADSRVFLAACTAHSAAPIDSFVERYQESFLIEIQDFVACVFDNRTPSVTGLDGLKPVVTALAAIKSLQENRPVGPSEITSSMAHCCRNAFRHT
jgi:myo-inositol 2-dehydrogenase / D-chiro-inositol 1-dehydrogenase